MQSILWFCAWFKNEGKWDNVVYITLQPGILEFSVWGRREGREIKTKTHKACLYQLVLLPRTLAHFCPSLIHTQGLSFKITCSWRHSPTPAFPTQEGLSQVGTCPSRLWAWDGSTHSLAHSQCLQKDEGKNPICLVAPAASGQRVVSGNHKDLLNAGIHQELNGGQLLCANPGWGSSWCLQPLWFQ